MFQDDEHDDVWKTTALNKWDDEITQKAQDTKTEESIPIDETLDVSNGDDSFDDADETKDEWWIYTPQGDSTAGSGMSEGLANRLASGSSIRGGSSTVPSTTNSASASPRTATTSGSTTPSTGTTETSSNTQTLNDDETQNEWLELFSAGNSADSNKESKTLSTTEESSNAPLEVSASNTVEDDTEVLFFDEGETLDAESEDELESEDGPVELTDAPDEENSETLDVATEAISVLSDLTQSVKERLGADTTKRDVRLTQNNHQLKLMARSKNADTGDKSAFRLVMDASPDGALAAFDFFQKGTEEDKSGYRFRINLYEIVEWKPVNEGDVYNPNNSTVVGGYNIGNSGWKQFDGKTFKISSKTVGEEKLFTFEASTVDGVFTVRGHAAGKALSDNKLSLNANKVKFDYIINNYPYSGKDGETSLALKAKIMSRMLPHTKTVSDGGELTISNANNANATAVAFFNWDSNVSIDGGETVKVVSSSLNAAEDPFQLESGEQENKVYFSLQTTKHSKVITWDPSMGVNPNSSSMAVLSFMAVMFSAIMFLLM